MVLTDRQRADLHAGIYEYLLSRPGPAFAEAARAVRTAAPEACERFGAVNTADTGSNANSSSSNGHTPLLEKKWTAIPRLQKKVLELEKQAAQSAKIHAHRVGSTDGMNLSSTSAGGGGSRMLPRLPPSHTLAGHSMVVTCCAIHPVFTIAVSGSEDGTIKVRAWQYLIAPLRKGDISFCFVAFVTICVCLAWPSCAHCFGASISYCFPTGLGP
jgi:platelet-activating factor acetylhydrolase IB subunit alpha